MINNASALAPVAHRNIDEIFGISPFGFVVQSLRINCLLPSDAFATMGLRLTYGEDWSKRLCRSQKLKESLLKAAPSAYPLSPLWDLRQWQAFGDGLTYSRASLTACPECLKTGYHSMLFQMPWTNRCPWHDLPLISQCPVCASPLWKSISRDLSALVCACGSDLVDAMQLVHEPKTLIEARIKSLKRYLRWAQESRDRRDLFGLEQDSDLWEDTIPLVFKNKLAWSRHGTPKDSNLSRVSIVRHEPNLPCESEQNNLLRIANDTGRSRDLFLELPVSFELPMRHVSSCVATKFSPNSFSERERICLGIDGASEYEEWQPRASVILLRAYYVQEKLFFDGRILSRPVQTILQQICLSIAHHVRDKRRTDGYVRAYERVLYRGYATAAHHALAKIEEPVIRPKAVAWKPVVMVRRRKKVSRLVLLWLGDPPAK